ncbi:unnamed protein product [Acanthoscelides obtectus]|uniref:RRM domain-containing protein n=1 Tax=Acanthoscelides obtectus TaxID=200917 RepID=A0A9P0L0B5_ACAOB|nr:unnamed protein product [Acanthoscelides obtectus]CAK1670692.1 Nuclear receptor coactivator 5 [Acanthoscelides obtectus]
MYRTDKQFMKDPATVASRIYIGGIAKTVIPGDLELVFGKYGKIVGMSINPTGFAFIQYEHEEEAQAAIECEDEATLHGKPISVRKAYNPGSGPAAKNKPQQTNTPNKQKPPPAPSAMPQTNPPGHDRSQNDDNMEEERPNIRPPAPGPQQHRQGGRRGGRGAGPGGPPGGRGGPGGRSRSNERGSGMRFEPPHLDNYNRGPYHDRNEPPHRGPPPVFEAPPPVAPEKNDCEIIVVSKALTEYAEFIESKLKHLGLMVDLLFPNEDVPIGKVLANISSRGCLYAILVMPINEEHRSLTLNILHGTPQEHRNMPVEDAMILISRDFEAYMKGEHLAPETAKSILDRHPVPMQMLLNLLAENRQLTSLQYDRLIAYLQERRDLQHEFEVAEGLVPDSQDGDSKQAELQNRIMNILNTKAAAQEIPTSITAPDPPSVTDPEATPILKDPTVQKALDSLMLGDMFKNIAGV